MTTRHRTTVARLATPVVVALLAAGCGDLYADPIESSPAFETDQAGPNVSIDASASIPRDFLMNCPVDAPVEGGACNTPGAACEYGSSPDMRCNTTLACVPDASFGASWVARPSVLCPTYQGPTGDSASIDGTSCGLPTMEAGAPSDSDELVCPMTGGICACTTGADAAHAHARRWVCVKPTPSCPYERPLAGQSCTSQRACDYGSCGFKRGVQMECTSNVWITGSAPCAN